MLPSYTMSRGNCVPNVPPRNPPTGINYENCFSNQQNENDPVQYYVLENPEETLGSNTIVQ